MFRLDLPYDVSQPCNSEKKPLTKHGFKDATTNEQDVWDAWDRNPERRHPSLRQIAELVKGRTGKRDPFNHAHGLLHVANGMLQIEAGGEFTLLPFSPEHYSRNRCEIMWDDKAQ